MTDLLELYQELILDHNRSPRNRGELENADHAAEGYNPLCGDRVTVRLILDGDVIRDIRFEGSGCAISTASASLMSEAVKGRTIAEVRVRRGFGAPPGVICLRGGPLRCPPIVGQRVVERGRSRPQFGDSVLSFRGYKILLSVL